MGGQSVGRALITTAFGRGRQVRGVAVGEANYVAVANSVSVANYVREANYVRCTNYVRSASKFSLKTMSGVQTLKLDFFPVEFFPHFFSK